jgi:uncharacterized protein (DUF305 family)
VAGKAFGTGKTFGRITPATVLAIAALLAAPAAQAQTEHGGHAGDQGVTAPGAVTDPAAEAYNRAMARMHQGMAIAPSGSADVDFARGMIAHHQGAIEMAQIVLDYGQDPELRQLAEDIISAQEAEILFMRTWLERNAPDDAAPEDAPAGQ